MQDDTSDTRWRPDYETETLISFWNELIVTIMPCYKY